MAGNLAPGLILALGMSPQEKSDSICAFAEPAMSFCHGVCVATELMLCR